MAVRVQAARAELDRQHRQQGKVEAARAEPVRQHQQQEKVEEKDHQRQVLVVQFSLRY